jgi:dihydrodipicolinate reductase
MEMTHTARSREGCASGAVIAAEWLCGSGTQLRLSSGKPAGEVKKGIFTMDDVLKDILP